MADVAAVARCCALVVVLAGCSSPAPVQTTPSSLPSESSVPASTATAADPTATASGSLTAEPSLTFEVATYPVPVGSHPHDVAPAVGGGVWYTAQGTGRLGWLDPATGDVREIPLGPGSAPHGVITGLDGAAWITDSGLNAIVRVDPETEESTIFALGGPYANLNTAAFDADGVLWFTGQAGIYGSLDPATGEMALHGAPRGQGPYGIVAAPDGEVVFGSLAGSYLGVIDRATGDVTVIDTPTPGGGARRVWSDSTGRLWVTEWFTGSLAMYDLEAGAWTEWTVPGANPMPYAVYVDGRDAVWVTDFGSNALLRFDPSTEEWLTFEHESQPAEVRQLLGRAGEVWGAESAADQLVVVRTGG